MATLYEVLTWLHIAAWATVLLGYLKDIRRPIINPLMTHGLEAALLLGLVLTCIASASDAVADPNNVKVAVKLGIAVAAVGVAHSTSKRPAPNPFAHVIAALVLVNVVLAYTW